MKNTYFKDVAGVILAGGKSQRFGRNKALEIINGKTLIETVVHVMRSLFNDLLLITNSPDEYRFLNIPMEKDIIYGLGPIGGIYTALNNITSEAGFFVACDMPSLKPELIKYIVDKRENVNVVVPRISGQLEPLHALYSKNVLPVIKKHIDAGQYQILKFFPEISIKYIEEDEIRRFDPELGSFFNINRPHELRRLKDTC